MWSDLPISEREEYKKLILAFASLTEMFAQKVAEEGQNTAPIINSKFQETAFQKAFNAIAEDIGNTSYDVSVQCNGEKYLIGIKTFGISSGDQKVAQFKAKHDEWSKLIDEMKNNAISLEDKDAINRANLQLYLELARKIAIIRNERIESSYANARGFRVNIEDSKVHSVYHVLMPSSKSETPKIYVGETSYDKIDIDNLEILGCTGKNNPTNFFFSDGKHVYKYTSADSQLHMNFTNREIVCDEWDVKYADDAHAIFCKIAEMVYPTLVEKTSSNEDSSKRVNREVEETYCWTIWNKNKEMELYSGFNSFYGTGSKMGKEQREQRIEKICKKYEDNINRELLCEIKEGMTSYLLKPQIKSDEKERLREYVRKLSKKTQIPEIEEDVVKVLYRPMSEMYIPIPDSAEFHRNHPNFFGKDFGKVIEGTSKLALPKEQRRFNLVFDPSGDILPAYITQSDGKAIESAEKQSYLGEWILRGIFQLGEYEPLTSKRLEELNINGLKFTRYKGCEDVHVEFIWIDEANPPEGFIAKT